MACLLHWMLVNGVHEIHRSCPVEEPALALLPQRRAEELGSHAPLGPRDTALLLAWLYSFQRGNGEFAPKPQPLYYSLLCCDES